MIIKPFKLTGSLTTSTIRNALHFTIYLYRGAFAPLHNYMIKYKALLVVDVVKLTVSLMLDYHAIWLASEAIWLASGAI